MEKDKKTKRQGQRGAQGQILEAFPKSNENTCVVCIIQYVCLCFLCIQAWVKRDNVSVPQNSTTDLSDKRMTGRKAKIQTLVHFRTLQSRGHPSDFVQQATFSNNAQQSHEHHPGSS